jgi:hypothetical protein
VGACGHDALHGFEAVTCTYVMACTGQDVTAVATKLQKTGDLIAQADQTGKKSKRRKLACKAIATTKRAKKLAQRLGRKGNVAIPCRDELVDALVGQAAAARALFKGRCP